MLFIYSFLCIGFILLAKRTYKEWINPILMCFLPWFLMVLFYEFKWIKYYDLSIKTYIVLICSVFLYGLGALCGNYFNIIKIRIKRHKYLVPKQEYLRKYRQTILILAWIGVLPTIIEIFSNVKRYGIFFFTKLSLIYAERVQGAFVTESIPYIGSMFFVSVLMSGIYFAQYGFHKVLIFPIVFTLMQPLKGGARQALVECILFFIIPFFVVRKEKMKISKPLKKKMLFLFMAMLLLVVLLIIFNQRSSYVNSSAYNSYASEEFAKIIIKIPGIYQLYTYFSSPVGVLNKFLENPEYSFGKNTLFPFYNLLNKFGFGIKTERYQKFYKIPISQNVGTAVRELIEDYGMFFGLTGVLLCGILIGINYRNYKRNKTLSNIYTICFIYMLICMSWFTWFLRDANLIIALVVGILVCGSLDAKEIKNCGE